MLNGARKKHGTEVTKIGQNNHSFFTVYSCRPVLRVISEDWVVTELIILRQSIKHHQHMDSMHAVPVKKP